MRKTLFNAELGKSGVLQFVTEEGWIYPEIFLSNGSTGESATISLQHMSPTRIKCLAKQLNKFSELISENEKDYHK